ncbi:MAG: hypothetical protein KatS3mg071_2554 [Meiothermus sp.]|nr:MAG: hypothetical protein KatS3mg071_2554 [Meiothermus sp.]
MSKIIINPFVFGAKVSGLSATWYDGYAVVGWNALAADSYEIGIASVSGGPYTFFAVGNNTSFEVGGLLNGTTYYLVVRAIIAGVPQPTSDEVSGSPSNTAGYSQTDADAGWRNAGGGIQSINTAANRSWQGDAGIFRQSVGFYNENGQDYDTPTLQLPSPARRLRLRIVDVATPDSPISIWIRSQTQWYGDQWQVFWDPSSNFISLGEITGGTYTYVTGASGPSRSNAQAHTLEVRDTGTIISVYANGSLLVSHPTTSKASNQYCGFQIGPGSSGRVRWLSIDNAA